MPQYLARLAAEATTVINAEDYGRTIYDLAVRRNLIGIGEDVVNAAYDAPVDLSPRAQIEEAERRLYEIAEQGRYDGGFQSFSEALTTAIDMAAEAYERDGKLSGVSTGMTDLDRKMGGLQSSDLIILAGRPGMGKTALATNIAFNIAKAYEDEVQADGAHQAAKNGGIVGFFSLEMSAEQLATRIIAEQSGVPSYKIRRGDIQRPRVPPHCRSRPRDAVDPLLHRPDRRHLDRAARRPRATAQAPEGPRRSRGRLPATAQRLARRATATACRNSPRSPRASRRSPRS